MTTNRTVLEVRDLSTSFRTEHGSVRAVDRVSLNLEENEIVALVGESGCGKSVTADSIMRLHDEKSTSYEGEVRFDGVDVLALGEEEVRSLRGNGIGMIFQDPMNSLNPVFTVGNQLKETIRQHEKVSKAKAKRQALSLLEQVGLPDPENCLTLYPHELSGGMKQRVMIAMALSSSPRVLIADEPTTALDVTTQSQILHLIQTKREESGLGVIIITHDLGVVAEVCDRVAVMYLGQIVEEAPVAGLFDRPLHPYTRGLLASTPTIDHDPSVDLVVIPGRVPTLHNVPQGCRFADRCRFATPACQQQPIPLVEREEGRTVRCIRIDEIETEGVAR